MGKSLEAPKGSVWALFLTAHAVVVEAIEVRLARAGLPGLAWYDVLWALERAGDRRLRMRELAELTVISRSNLTRLVDRLESAGLVVRERAQEDRRGAFAVISAQGRALRRKMWPVYAAAIKDLFEDRLTEREAAVMGDALRRTLGAVRERQKEET
jgi:DNA-binding MarR family transcriptional regulator